MTNHFTVLIKGALASLDAPTTRARQEVYETVRLTLLEKMRDTQPPLKPAEVTRQRLALEDAIRQIERDFNRIGVAAFARARKKHDRMQIEQEKPITIAGASPKRPRPGKRENTPANVSGPGDANDADGGGLSPQRAKSPAPRSAPAPKGSPRVWGQPDIRDDGEEAPTAPAAIRRTTDRGGEREIGARPAAPSGRSVPPRQKLREQPAANRTAPGPVRPAAADLEARVRKIVKPSTAPPQADHGSGDAPDGPSPARTDKVHRQDTDAAAQKPPLAPAAQPVASEATQSRIGLATQFLREKRSTDGEQDTAASPVLRLGKNNTARAPTASPAPEPGILRNDSRDRRNAVGSLARPTGLLLPVKEQKRAGQGRAQPPVGEGAREASSEQRARAAGAAGERRPSPGNGAPSPEPPVLSARRGFDSAQMQAPAAGSRRIGLASGVTLVAAALLIMLVGTLIWRAGILDPTFEGSQTAATSDSDAVVSTATSSPNRATAPQAVDTVKISPPGAEAVDRNVTSNEVVARATESGAAALKPARAVLFEPNTNPALAEGGKHIEHAGTVVWEFVRERDGEKSNDVLRALVDIPAKRLKLRLRFIKDTGDGSQAESYVVRLDFEVPKDFANGTVAQVVRVFTKPDLSDSSAPLFSSPMVPLIDGHFMMVLSAIAEDHRRNMAMLRSNSWFDIPLVYADETRAFLSIEKGTAGTSAVEAALAAWRQ